MGVSLFLGCSQPDIEIASSAMMSTSFILRVY